MSDASNSRSIARDSFTNGPMADQAVQIPKTNRLVSVVEASGVIALPAVSREQAKRLTNDGLTMVTQMLLYERVF